MSTKFQKVSLVVGVLGLLASISLLIANVIVSSKDTFKDSIEMSYTEFQENLENGDIDTVLYSSSDEYMYFYLFDESTRGLSTDELKNLNRSNLQVYKTPYPATSSFREDMLNRGVNLQIIKSDELSDESIFYLVLAIFLSCVVIYFSMKNIIKSSADIKSMIKHPDTKFTDVIGLDEVIEEVKFAVDYLKSPAQYEEVGVRMPAGILFHGEPGTGKTLLARAIAGEAEVPFIHATVGDLTSSFQAGGAKKVNNLFRSAKKIAPCILFIDEIDAVGLNRGMLGSSEANQTLNALLSELDGFDRKSGVLVIATTNCIDRLDPALIRSGRFDRKLKIKTPTNSKVRKQMFEYFLSKYSCEDEVTNSLDVLARETIGCTGADIETICNEAGILAIRGDRNKITYTDLEDAYDNHLIQGCKRLDDFEDGMKHRIAVHEAGHALMAYLSGVPIARVVVAQSTSNNSTYTRMTGSSDDDNQLFTRQELEQRIRINYAGHAAEVLVLGESSNGASQDLDSATMMIVSGIKKFGMYEDFGVLCELTDQLGALENQRNIDVYKLAKKVSKDCYEQTEDLLMANLPKLEALYKEIEKSGVLSGARLSFLLDELDK